MLQPSRVKYRKAHRGDRRGTATRGAALAFGEVGLQAQEAVWLSARQIEAARRVIVRYLRRGGDMWIRVFPDKPVTAKPAETRMGSGKGAPDHWVAVVKRGRIIFEVAGIDPKQAKEALLLASHKLPIPCSIIERQVVEKAPAAAEAEMAS